MEMAASKMMITKWTDTINVGIWDNETWTVRLYPDRAIAQIPCIRWRGNSGSLAKKTLRITGQDLSALITIARQQSEDYADYTDRVWQIISQAC